MSVRSLLRSTLTILLPLALLSTAYLYLYPAFHACAFPSTDGNLVIGFLQHARQHVGLGHRDGEAIPSTLAPIRLLVLADPQLEGDSSLPKSEDALLSRLAGHWDDILTSSRSMQDFPATLLSEIKQIVRQDMPDALNGIRKRLDLFGNDYYLAHIYQIMRWWTNPTHVTVLGDLIGSQWVTDGEFERRGWRFWNRVFAGGSRVGDEITNGSSSGHEKGWDTRIINIAGNHDIGYAGDISEERMVRFEKVFGKANWDIRFDYPWSGYNTTGDAGPTLHVIVLNSLNLDTPALSDNVQDQTYDFLNNLMSERIAPVEDRRTFTLLLTHLPLHKPDGVCVDAPWFDFYGDDDGGGVYRPHGLKEQNHLSDRTSRQGILGGLFGLTGDPNAAGGGKGRNGLILTGHDHEGCDVWHYIPESLPILTDEGSEERHTNWQVIRWPNQLLDHSHAGLREVTIRSMMGDYGGNAGLLSLWFDFAIGEWKYDIQMCRLGVQHIWWAVHIVDITTTICLLLWLILMGRDPAQAGSSSPISAKAKQKKTKRVKRAT